MIIKVRLVDGTELFTADVLTFITHSLFVGHNGMVMKPGIQLIVSAEIGPGRLEEIIITPETETEH